MGKEGVVLKDGVDVAPVGRQTGDRNSIHEDVAGVGLLEAGEHA